MFYIKKYRRSWKIYPNLDNLQVWGGLQIVCFKRRELLMLQIEEFRSEEWQNQGISNSFPLHVGIVYS